VELLVARHAQVARATHTDVAPHAQTAHTAKAARSVG